MVTLVGLSSSLILTQAPKPTQAEMVVRPKKQVEIVKETAQPKVEVRSTPQPQAKRPAVVAQGDCYAAMREVFPQEQWENASLVISKESGGRSNAVSSTNDHGCFQINKGLALYGEQIYNPSFNAQIALGKYNGRNQTWAAWYAVCTTQHTPKYPGIKCS